MPTIALNDFEVAVPVNPTDVRTEDITLTQQAVEPLRTYRVAARGNGAAYDDPAGLLRGEAGRPGEVSMDLVWHIRGRRTPTGWPRATRSLAP